MATFSILVLVSKTEIRSREISFSSRSLRMKIINLDLLSMPEIGGDFFSVSSRSLRLSVRNSRSRLDVRDWIRETLILVSIMKKWLSLTSGMNILTGWDRCRLWQLTSIQDHKKFKLWFSWTKATTNKVRQSSHFNFQIVILRNFLQIHTSQQVLSWRKFDFMITSNRRQRLFVKDL